MLRPVDKPDVRFLRDMLRHAYHWRLARDPELRASIDQDVSQTFLMAAGLLEKTGSPNPNADAMLVSSAMMGFLLERIARPDDRAVARRVKAAVRRMVELLFP